MRTQVFVWTFVSLLGVSPANAQEPRDFSQLSVQTVQLPGTNYSIVFNSPELQVGDHRNMAVLAAAVASWLSANFGLPTMRGLPHIEYVSASDIALFRSTRWGASETTAKILEVYIPHTQTIYLPEDWDGSTVADLSLFVLGMAEHLRHEAQARYYCKPAHNEFALAVRSRWLGMFGTSGGGDLNPHCFLRRNRAEN